MTIECWQVHHLMCRQAKPRAKDKFVVIVGQYGGTYYTVPVNTARGLPNQFTAFGPNGYPYLTHQSHACFNDFWCFTANDFGASTYRGPLAPADAQALSQAILTSPAVRPKYKKIICP